MGVELRKYFSLHLKYCRVFWSDIFLCMHVNKLVSLRGVTVLIVNKRFV